MMFSSVVIHRVGVARKRQERVRKGFPKEASNAQPDIRSMKTLSGRDEDILPQRAINAVKKLRNQPVTAGVLKKRGKSWMGLGETKWRERYVVLDPCTGNLSYWDTKHAKSKSQLEALFGTHPKHEYSLEDLIMFEANEYHNTIMLTFCRQKQPKQVGQCVTFMANSEEDFDQWVEVLSHYGMKDSCTPVAAAALAA